MTAHPVYTVNPVSSVPFYTSNYGLPVNPPTESLLIIDRYCLTWDGEKWGGMDEYLSTYTMRIYTSTKP